MEPLVLVVTFLVSASLGLIAAYAMLSMLVHVLQRDMTPVAQTGLPLAFDRRRMEHSASTAIVTS